MNEEREAAQEAIRRLTNIPSDCSEGEEELDHRAHVDIPDGDCDNSLCDPSIDGSSDTDDEETPDIVGNQPDTTGLLGKDESKWTLLQDSTSDLSSGRRPVRNVFKSSAGCKSRTRREIDSDNFFSAFNLIFDDAMINCVIKHTITEARRQGNDAWSIDKSEFLAFLGILIIRGATTASKFDADML